MCHRNFPDRARLNLFEEICLKTLASVNQPSPERGHRFILGSMISQGIAPAAYDRLERSNETTGSEVGTEQDIVADRDPFARDDGFVNFVRRQKNYTVCHVDILDVSHLEPTQPPVNTSFVNHLMTGKIGNIRDIPMGVKVFAATHREHELIEKGVAAIATYEACAIVDGTISCATGVPWELENDLDALMEGMKLIKSRL